MNSTTKNFSVAMCVYKNDNPEHFKQALDSVIYQSLPPSEIILVIDGPVSSSIMNIIHEYTSKLDSFRPIWLKKNRGHTIAREIALENCTYDLVAIMDSDDISMPDRFKNQVKCFEEDEELSVVGGIITEFVENKENIVSIKRVPLSDEGIKSYIKSRNPINNVTAMYKKEHVKKAGGYEKLYYCYEDYYLFVRMYEMGCKFKNIDDVLVNVRVGNDMYSRRGGYKLFVSNIKLQNYMLRNRLISIWRYLFNIIISFLIRVILTDRLRGYLYRKFLRSNNV